MHETYFNNWVKATAMQSSLNIRYKKYISGDYTYFLVLKLLQTFISFMLFSCRVSIIRLAAIIFTLYSITYFIGRFFLLRAHQALISPTFKLPSGSDVLCYKTYAVTMATAMWITVDYSRLLLTWVWFTRVSSRVFWRPGREIAVAPIAEIKGQSTGSYYNFFYLAV